MIHRVALEWRWHYRTNLPAAATGGNTSGMQTITRAAHRFNQPVVCGRFERRAQTPDVHVHRTLLDKHMIAPHMVE